MQIDILRINGIRSYGYVGYFQEEKSLGQWFQADLTLEVDMQPAAESDDLDKTVDYAQLINMTKSTIAASRVDLIETLAAHILNQLLDVPKIYSAQIQLTKEAPPIPNFSGTVMIQMKRIKEEHRS